MQKSKSYAYEYLFPITGLLLVTGSWMIPSHPLTLSLHNTYFVIGPEVVGELLCLHYMLVFLAYRLLRYFRRPLHRGLGFIQYTLSTVSLITMIILFHTTAAMRSYQTSSIINEVLSVATLVFLFTHLLFIVNVLMTLLRKKTMPDAR